MASPLDIMIGLHYWTTPTEYAADDPQHQRSSGVRERLAWMVRAGFLERLEAPNQYGGSYKATEGLGVWVEALCAVPYPMQQWVIPK